ncbi:hypothetical protein Dimus_023241, partial [Dionaea muscipula]
MPILHVTFIISLAIHHHLRPHCADYTIKPSPPREALTGYPYPRSSPACRGHHRPPLAFTTITVACHLPPSTIIEIHRLPIAIYRPSSSSPSPSLASFLSPAAGCFITKTTRCPLLADADPSSTYACFHLPSHTALIFDSSPSPSLPRLKKERATPCSPAAPSSGEKDNAVDHLPTIASAITDHPLPSSTTCPPCHLRSPTLGRRSRSSHTEPWCSDDVE